jgi:hypothetical protein
MLSRAERTERMAVWLQRLQECRESKQTLVDYTRRHGYKLDEAYRWTHILRRVGQWPGARQATRKGKGKGKAARIGLPAHFARVRIVDVRPVTPTPVRVQVQLVNGRRADVILDDEEQLPRLMSLLEHPA